MNVQRCPECGQRLKTNYCDICMRRVPFGGVKLSDRQDPWEIRDGSSAHRMERGHECVSFGEERKVTWAGSSAHQTEKGHKCISFEKELIKPVFSPAKKQTAASNKKTVPLLAIILAAISLLPTLFGIFEDRSHAEVIPVPEPDASYYEEVPFVQSQELYNDGQIIVTADFAELSYDDYAVYMTVFNESEEDVIVGTDLLSVNGFMHQSSFYASVESGEAVQEVLQLYTWELEQDGITEIANISFYLNIYREEDYSDIARSELITIETNLADTYEPPMEPNGWDLYENDDVLLRLTGIMDNFGNVEMQFYLENLSEDTIAISTLAFYINDEATDGFLWETLRVGTCAGSTIYVAAENITELSQIEEITMELLIEHIDGYEVTDSYTQTITFAP